MSSRQASGSGSPLRSATKAPSIHLTRSFVRQNLQSTVSLLPRQGVDYTADLQQRLSREDVPAIEELALGYGPEWESYPNCLATPAREPSDFAQQISFLTAGQFTAPLCPSSVYSEDQGNEWNDQSGTVDWENLYARPPSPLRPAKRTDTVPEFLEFDGWNAQSSTVDWGKVYTRPPSPLRPAKRPDTLPEFLKFNEIDHDISGVLEALSSAGSQTPPQRLRYSGRRTRADSPSPPAGPRTSHAAQVQERLDFPRNGSVETLVVDPLHFSEPIRRVSSSWGNFVDIEATQEQKDRRPTAQRTPKKTTRRGSFLGTLAKIVNKGRPTNIPDARRAKMSDPDLNGFVLGDSHSSLNRPGKPIPKAKSIARRPSVKSRTTADKSQISAPLDEPRHDSDWTGSGADRTVTPIQNPAPELSRMARKPGRPARHLPSSPVRPPSPLRLQRSRRAARPDIVAKPLSPGPPRRAEASTDSLESLEMSGSQAKRFTQQSQAIDDFVAQLRDPTERAQARNELDHEARRLKNLMLRDDSEERFNVDTTVHDDHVSWLVTQRISEDVIESFHRRLPRERHREDATSENFWRIKEWLEDTPLPAWI